MITKYLMPDISEKDKSYPLYVVTVGSEIQSLVNRPSGIEHHQLLFSISGKGKIRLKKNIFDISENTFMYLKPYTPQYYYPVSTPWNVMWITYEENRSFEILDLNSGIYSLDSITPYTNILSEIMESNGLTNFIASSSVLLYKLLITLNDEMFHFHPEGINSNLSFALDYIKHHYTEPIEISFLAEKTGISTEHFCRLFKQTCHLRPLEYIQHLRFEEAKKKLVMFPTKSIKNIAESVGYNDASYFTKMFSKIEGVTPLQYRKKLGDNAFFGAD